MNKWRMETWGDLATLEYGRALGDYHTAPGPFRVYGTNGPIGWAEKALYHGPSVIIGRKGAYRGVHYSPAPFFVIDTAFYLKPKVNFDMGWAYYQLLTQDINSMDSGSAIPSTSREDFYGLPVALPSPEEQRGIADFLRALDDQIELSRQMNETLEGMARAIFKSWLVDFDPIRAKYEGRQPFGMDAETAALFPSGFDDSNLGRVPRGWTPERWGNLVTLEYGKSLLGYDRPQGEYPVYGTNGPIGWHDKALCPKPGVVIGRKGAYRGVHFSRTPFYAIDTAFYLSPKTEFDIYWAYFEILQFDINGMDSGSAIPSTSREDFYAIPVIVPPLPVMKAFGETAALLYRKVDANLAESATLASLRDLLLPKLISGEIRLKDAEKELVAI